MPKSSTHARKPFPPHLHERLCKTSNQIESIRSSWQRETGIEPNDYPEMAELLEIVNRLDKVCVRLDPDQLVGEGAL